MIAFAVFGLMIIALQRVLLATMPPIPQNPCDPPFADMLDAAHSVWFVYLPLMFGGGIIYVVAGFLVRRGSHAARRIAQANAIAGYLWVIAYSISCYQIIHLVSPPKDVLPEPANAVFQWMSIIGGTVTGAAFPTGLLYLLSRPSDQITKKSNEPAK
jgi:hypothetical protein